jgi:hypothetical protein
VCLDIVPYDEQILEDELSPNELHRAVAEILDLVNEG